MTIAWSGVKKFAGAHRPVQGATKSSAVALEHQGAGKRTMPAPPRKLNVNPNTGGHVNFSHKLRAEAGAASQWFPRIFSISRAIGRATCKRISRKGGREESPEQSWDGREVAFAPAHLAPSNKPSRDLNHCMEPRPSAACQKDLESFCLTHQVATGSGGPGDNPIRPGLLSRTPAVPPRPLKATANDAVSGVMQAGKSQYHKLFSFIRCVTLNRRASNHIATVLFCCGAPPPPHSVSPWDKFELALMAALLVAAAARFIYLRCFQRREP